MLEISDRNRFSLTPGFIACVAIAGFATSAAAQNSTVMTGNANDLRPLYADAGDIAEGKRLADSSCGGCHGANGIRASPGVPNLAGQRPAYLYLELRAYQSGVRGDSAMNNAVKFLNDDALVKVAAYFSSLEPAQPRPASGSAAVVPKPDALQAGKSAAAVCTGCHGEQGVSGTPTTPSLAGQDAEYTTAALRAYKDGTRNNETMKGLATPLDDAAIKNLAAYYTTQQPQAPKVRKPLTTQEWTERCERCHGLNGNSNSPRLQALAGQRTDYLIKVLLAYRAGARKSPEMAAMSGDLTENDIDNLAAYFAGQRARSVLYVVTPGK